ncbi:MAG: hypothetical protein R2800_12845 [Flavipsychrobacter sp.]
MPTIGGEITVSDANSHINAFISSYFTPGDFPVKSFIFDAGLLKSYLDNNPSIVNMKFMLAEKEFLVDGNTKVMPTMVLVGYDSSGNYVKLSNGKVLNSAEPCPTMCPTVGAAANDNIS